MRKGKTWTTFVMVHVIFMGIWGALIELPEKNGFPATLGYVVWALTMIPASLLALRMNNWNLDFDKRSILFGLTVGILGALGQLALFYALKVAPAYLIFPLLSLTPVITILLSVLFLKEKTGKLGWIGIIIAIGAIFLLSYQPEGSDVVRGYDWVFLAMIPLFAWGTQGFLMRFGNEKMQAESLFFYMTIGSILLIPFAILMTDFSTSINWGLDGPVLAAVIQILNAFGALSLVYAFRYGKAIIVAPMTTALSPVLTVIISLTIYSIFPHPFIITGIIMAIVSALLMVVAEAKGGKAEEVNEEQ